MTGLREPGTPGGTRAEESRTTLDALTTARFEKTWPQVERRLLALLRTLKVPRDRGEDYVQEAAIRVLQTRVRYDDADDLYPWAALVVRRLAIDAWRRERFLIDDDALARRADPVDVAYEVERRLALDAVLAAWPALSDRDRCALVLAVEERALQGEEAQALHAARYRARGKLRAAARGLLGWLGVLHARRAWKAGSAVMAPVAAAVTVAVLLPSLLGPSEPSRARGLSQEATPAAASPVVTDLGTPSSHPSASGGLAERPVVRPPDRRARTTRIERRTPTGKSVFVEHDPDARGPLLCAELGPPIGKVCTPSLGPTPTPFPTPAVAAGDAART